MKRRTLALSGLLAAVTIGLAGSSAVQTAPSAEPRFARLIEVAGKQVPLPEGEWIMTGRAAVAARRGEGDTVPPLENLVLVRIDGGAVNAFVHVHANAAPSERGYGHAKDCKRTDLHFAAELYASQIDLLCAYVAHVETATDPGDSASWRATFDLARSRGWLLPHTWLAAGFRVSDRQDLIEVRYHFAVADATAATDARWSDNPWAPGKVDSVPERKRRVRDLIAWAGHARPAVEQGQRGQLGDLPAMPEPFARALPPLSPVFERRLERLDELLARGAVSPSTFADQRAQILAEAQAEAEGLPLDAMLTITGIKTLTYKILARIDALVVSWFWVSGPVQLATLSTAQFVTHLPTFTINDFLWSYFGIKGRRERPPLELAGAGNMDDEPRASARPAPAPTMVRAAQNLGPAAPNR